MQILTDKSQTKSGLYWPSLLSAPAGAPDACLRPDTPGEEEADHDHPQGQDLLQPQDLSLKRPEVKTEAEAGLFRPYCLKDPVEYKYDRPPPLAYDLPRVPLSPRYIRYRNIEDLATAQAILDLSKTSPSLPQPQAPASPDYLDPTSDIKTEEDAGSAAAVFKINGGRTTAYTYEVSKNFKVSHSRTGCLLCCFRPFSQVMAVPRSNSLK